MTKNQAFAILQRAGGIRAARIITENTEKISTIKIYYMAYLLRRGVPVAKIIHMKWFFGLQFYTNRHTLDPRPDTETLVSAVISDCDTTHAPDILDLGTGSGCIICALIKNIHGAHGMAIDKSWRALRVARRNIRTHGLTQCIQTTCTTFDRTHNFGRRFDIIVSNPPYIAYGDSRVNENAMHDPKMALYAKEDGLAAYKSIARNAHTWIKQHGKLYLEIGIDQAQPVKDIFLNSGWQFTGSYTDLGGIERVLTFMVANK